jgi:hypothetical protein
MLAAASLRLAADVLVTTDGARIVGKIKVIQGGAVIIETDYAGELKVKESLVTSMETDRPVALRLASGARVIGTVTPTTDGRLRIGGRGGDVFTSMDHVAASWAAADEDPDVVARRKKWSYAAGVDVTGSSGASNQLGTEVNLAAERKGPADDLQLVADYDRQVTNGLKSADRFKSGADYSDNFSDATSWYVRDEAGFDRVMDITFDDIAAAGFGYDIVKDKIETLTGRAGLSYRYDEYSAAADTANLGALGADFELQYWRLVGKSQLIDKVAYLPDFHDTNNFVATHDFSYVIPITRSLWKLAIGVTNTYNSRPVGGTSSLETLYFTRLEMTWGQK